MFNFINYHYKLIRWLLKICFQNNLHCINFYTFNYFIKSNLNHFQITVTLWTLFTMTQVAGSHNFTSSIQDLTFKINKRKNIDIMNINEDYNKVQIKIKQSEKYADNCNILENWLVQMNIYLIFNSISDN